MPNKYSHSGVLAQYCKSGFISLPEDLYLAYIRASSVGSLTIQSQRSVASRASSAEEEPEQHTQRPRPRNISSSSADGQGHHDERGRARRPVELPAFPFSHKPNPKDRAALISSLMNEIDNQIDNDPQPNVSQQPHSRHPGGIVQQGEPQRRHGIVIEDSAHAEQPPDTSRVHRHDRNAWKSTYPPLSHSGHSSASLAVSAASSGEYALEIPNDFPVHADGATAGPWHRRSEVPNENQSDASVDDQGSHQISRNVRNYSPTSDRVSKSTELDKTLTVPLRSVKRPSCRQECDGDAIAPKVITTVKLHSPWTYASAPSPTIPGRPRNSSRSGSRQRNEHNNIEDNSLPSISDSVSETAIEVVDNVGLSSDYENGVKIPEHEAAAITGLPSPQPALLPESVTPRQAPPPPAIGSNDARTVHHRRRGLSRLVSVMLSQTRIYAPLSSTFPAPSSYTDEPAFIPEPNVVGPGPLPESAIERAAEPPPTRRSHSRGRTDGPRASTSSPDDGFDDSSASVSDSGSVGMPSVQPGQPPRSAPHGNRSSKYMPVYRDRKQEWLEDPTHNVEHYRAYLLKKDSAGHRRFASGHMSPRVPAEGSSAQRLNSLPNMVVEPKFPEAQDRHDFDVRPASAVSDAASASTHTSEASSGFYPPDIPRYRDEVRQDLGRELKREDSAIGLASGRRSVTRSPSSSGQLWRRKKDKDKDKDKDKEPSKERDKAGHSLLRRLRGVSMSGIR